MKLFIMIYVRKQRLHRDGINKVTWDPWAHFIISNPFPTFPEHFQCFVHVRNPYSLSALKSPAETSSDWTCFVLDRSTFYRKSCQIPASSQNHGQVSSSSPPGSLLLSLDRKPLTASHPGCPSIGWDLGHPAETKRTTKAFILKLHHITCF